MWVIFQESQIVFNHLDKNVVALVEDDAIFQYQRELAQSTSGTSYEIHDVSFLQLLVKSDIAGDFFARKYKIWTSSLT